MFQIVKPWIITFDLFNTLIYTDPIAIYSKIARKYGLSGTSPSSFSTAFAAKEALEPHFGRCHISWWSAVVYNSLLPQNSKESLDLVFPSLYNDVLREFSLAESYGIYSDVVETLNALKKLNFKLGIISNSDIRSLHILNILDLAKFFDTVILSQTEQASKPDGKLFKKAFGNLNGIHVGDSLEKDYYGSKKAGINGLLLIRNGVYSDKIDRSDQIFGLDSLTNLKDFFSVIPWHV